MKRPTLGFAALAALLINPAFAVGTDHDHHHVGQSVTLLGGFGLLLEAPLAQRDRPRDRLDLLDVGQDRVLVHLGPRERVVAEDHDV